MKCQLSKQLFALTTALLLLSLLPSWTDAQTALMDASFAHPPKPKKCTNKTDASSINYWLASDGVVSISLYDGTGQLIRTLVDEWMPGGEHELAWNGKNEIGNTLHPGMYLLTLQAGDLKETTRVIAFN